MFFSLLSCFAFPILCALYGVLFLRDMAKYIPIFLVSSLLSAVTASAMQAITQPFFSKYVIFTGGTPALVLHAFVQAGLIEEVFKAIFFFLAFRRVIIDNREFYGIGESVSFYFAVLSGFLFASFETVAAIFYIPGAAVTRMFTAHILHPVALLVSASGIFFGKRYIAGYILPCAAAVLVHGFYNFVVGSKSLFGVGFYTIAALVVVLALWLKIFDTIYPYSRHSRKRKETKGRK